MSSRLEGLGEPPSTSATLRATAVLSEGASTRLLIYAGRMIAEGVSPRRACQVAIVWPLTDDGEVQRSIEEVVSSIFED